MIMYWLPFGPSQHMGQPILKYWWWIYVVLISLVETQMEPIDTALRSESLKTAMHNDCPIFGENSACPCYKFEDGKQKN